MGKPWYQRGYRRLLLDMHIPDWDERFLARFDPAEMVRLYRRAGLTSVMFYAQSHVGLCYWPTKTGRMHAGLRGRDILGQTLRLLRKARLHAVVYYSLIYNNWAYLEHPDWRLVPATPQAGQANGGRYGRCCPNNPDYRAFALAQTEELLRAYRFDGIFFDMTFWPRVCLCPHCRQRFRREAGADIPGRIDWFRPEWCRFQAAREQWMIDLAMAIDDRARRTCPGITVYHNFASAKSNWVPGVSFRIAAANDILGADLYGDPVEQMVTCKLMSNLAAHRPVEFMTSRCVSLVEHEHDKGEQTIRMQSLAATLFSAATFFIDAVDPQGTVNPRTYDTLRRVYREAARYEPYLGGQAVEDVAVYFSSDSKMDFAENGRLLADGAVWRRTYPHLSAVRGVCRVLQQAHVPFGVITRKQLGELGRYRVVVLPNILRMDGQEASAFREYVGRGGRLYASRYTSLTETAGRRREDFLLADVFGCHFQADDLGNATYLKPRQARVARALRPQRYLSHLLPPGATEEAFGTLRLRDRAEGEVLATLALPYSLWWGQVGERNWSSIHSSPPWNDTGTPALVDNRFGRGRCVYSAADIESKRGAANDRLLRQILLGLLGRPSARADTHPCVWMSVTDQPDRKRWIVGFLNYPAELPPIPIAKVAFRLRPPRGRRFVRLRLLPEGRPLKFSTDRTGAIRAELGGLEALRMLSAAYR